MIPRPPASRRRPIRHAALTVLALATSWSLSASANSPPVDTYTITGKVMVGYQGWFRCFGDGSPANNWLHWSPSVPKVDQLYPPSFPDTTDFGDGPGRCLDPYLTVNGGPA